MSESKVAELAAQRVESILVAAETAAEQIKQEARDQVAAEVADARKRAAEVEQRARDQAIEFDTDSRREAERVLGEARRRARQIKDQTKRSVEGRVDRADAAAAEMVGHAEALSQGLLKLGELLTEEGERILRDVRAARRDMRSQLDAAIRGESEPVEAPSTGEDETDPDAPVPLRRNGSPSRRFVRGEGPRSSEDLTPPSWVEPGR